jgi:RNA polymerase sigma factor (sigma-70 family)
MERVVARAAVAPLESQPSGLAAAGDDLLLARFVDRRDDRAFAELVARHGGLVMAVCRRVLGREQDAEDAFQATFLVLARKAASLRRAESLPAWLHQTAFRIALRARAGSARRREQPLEAEAMIAAESFTQIASEFEQSALDEELNRLPRRYRLPLFLCCVEGKSREQAAEQLGWSLGSLKGRLERARQLLRRRLLLRGVSLSVALVAAAAAYRAASASAAVSPSLIAATVQAGLQFAAGKSVIGYVSQNALSLAQGSLQIMSLGTVKIAACSLAVVGGLALVGRMIPAPALAEGSGAPVVVAFDGNGEAESFLVAQVEGERREGEARREEGARPDQREGERREGEVRREGDRPREGAREGVREGQGQVPEILRNFKPANPREAALAQMIMSLQREVMALRAELQQLRGGRAGEIRRDGDKPREGAPRDGDKPRDGAADGEKPRDGAPRDGEKPREGDKPREGAPRE